MTRQRLHGRASYGLDDLPRVRPRGATAREIEIVHAAIGVTLGYTVALRGDLARGEALLDEALHRSERIGMSFLKTDVLVRLAEVRLWRGALTQASEGARQALEGARARGERGQEEWTVRLLAEIASRFEPPDDAATETRLVEARDLATALGMCPLVAHCHLGLGKLSRRTGKREEAQEHLTTATTMYLEMDMQFWLEQAKAEQRGADLTRLRPGGAPTVLGKARPLTLHRECLSSHAWHMPLVTKPGTEPTLRDCEAVA